ncbi:hypothetical protein B566_EDAN013017, partial [Ephemera danica]
MDVAKIAQELKVYAAVTYCTKLLREHLDATDATTVCSILNMAILCDHLESKEVCT